MSMETVVDRLDARFTSRGHFATKCPAHDDRAPSLSISSGRDGRVLLHCFGGCHTSDILTAAGLRYADLFNGPPPTRERKAQAALHERRLQSLRELERDVYKLESIRNQLGAKLAAVANVPEGDELERLFHYVCDLHREAQTELDKRKKPRLGGSEGN
jgi:putative DNA primase/helicase